MPGHSVPTSCSSRCVWRKARKTVCRTLLYRPNLPSSLHKCSPVLPVHSCHLPSQRGSLCGLHVCCDLHTTSARGRRLTRSSLYMALGSPWAEGETDNLPPAKRTHSYVSQHSLGQGATDLTTVVSTPSVCTVSEGKGRETLGTKGMS